MFMPSAKEAKSVFVLLLQNVFQFTLHCPQLQLNVATNAVQIGTSAVQVILGMWINSSAHKMAYVGSKSDFEETNP